MERYNDKWWSTWVAFGSGLAIASQVSAFLAVAEGLALHALGFQVSTALACALVGLRAASRMSEARPIFTAIVAFALALTLPGLGLLGLTWVILPHWATARRRARDHLLELTLPEFHQTEILGFDAERGFSAIEDELSPERPTPQRVQAVMALRRIDPRRAVPLLRIALGDSNEDVRLLAYAILERREKLIRRRITQALADLRDDDQNENEIAASDRATLLRNLASAHWELVYGGFSEGEGEALNLEHAARWAGAALRLAFHGTTALLLARVRLKQGDPEAAWELILAAEHSGIAADVCAPLLAEAAFLRRDFECIPELLAHIDRTPSLAPRLSPVARFWNAGRNP